ncbi:MAG: hypothetical protein A2X64_01315 [Ignavibacteria bacterium GWF2_33_9]|nr:MAG: hypothetical protein A2X64_01315 [Ignavibacteria bacterium GWF2_33_9]
MKAENIVIPGETQQSEITNQSSLHSTEDFSLFSESKDGLSNRVNEWADEQNFGNTDYYDIEMKENQNELFALNSAQDDTTQTENDLSFDDFNTDTNPNANLLPENISWNERMFWGKSGVMRKLGLAGELSAEQRTKEIGWRRTFLTMHQTTGLLTLGLMLASCYTGQMHLNGEPNYLNYHEAFTTSTIVGYSLTGFLAFMTPPPSIKRNEFSTISVHKTLAYLHMAGMILTPILGSQIEDSSNWNKAAQFHQTSAYITTAIYASAMAVILLFD